MNEEILEKVVEETKRLIEIPSYKDCTQILRYLENRLDFINFKKQYVDKSIDSNPQYNLVNLSKPFMINTHVDTVPPINMENPFKPVIKDNKIYGRGAADTKGLIASLIVALEIFKEKYPDRDIPVSISFTVDEENHTALGSQKLIKMLDGIEYILVLEPTYGIICNQQIGTLEFEIETTVDSVHASEFEKADNPVKKLMHYVDKIETILERPVNIIKLNSGWDYYAVPEKANMLAEVKVFENEDIKTLEDKIKSILDKKSKFKNIDSEEFLKFNCDKEVDIVSQAYEKALNKEPIVGAMPSWTDAANYHKAGIKTTVFGFGSLKDAHTKREYISFSDLENMTKVLYNLFSILTQFQRS